MRAVLKKGLKSLPNIHFFMKHIRYVGALLLGSAVGLAATIFYKDKLEKEQKELYNKNPGLYKCVTFEKSLDDCIKNIENVKTSKNLDEKIEYLNLASSSINEPFSNGVFSINDANLNEKVEQSLLKLRISIIGKDNEEIQSKNYLNSLITALEVKNHYSINFFKERKDVTDEYFKNSIKLRKTEESNLGYFILLSLTTPVFIISCGQTLFGHISKNWKKEE
jgi:hypothetical protein